MARGIESAAFKVAVTAVVLSSLGLMLACVGEDPSSVAPLDDGLEAGAEGSSLEGPVGCGTAVRPDGRACTEHADGGTDAFGCGQARCAAGQRCKDGACVCDQESCIGCCTAEQTCEVGASAKACGRRGLRCSACDGGACSEGSCTSPPTCVRAFGFEGFSATCDDVCTARGKSCGVGCFPSEPTLVGKQTSDSECAGTVQSQVTRCDALVYVDIIESMACCCGP